LLLEEECKLVKDASGMSVAGGYFARLGSVYRGLDILRMVRASHDEYN
jgi:hypothetical protein